MTTLSVVKVERESLGIVQLIKCNALTSVSKEMEEKLQVRSVTRKALVTALTTFILNRV